MVTKNEEAIEKALDRRHDKFQIFVSRALITVCITATLSAAGALWNFGIYLYDNHLATQAAIDTFIKVKEATK